MHTYTDTDTHNNSYKQTPVFSQKCRFYRFYTGKNIEGLLAIFFCDNALKLCEELEYAISFVLVRRSKFQIFL
jgi:hypothetical protein